MPHFDWFVKVADPRSKQKHGRERAQKSTWTPDFSTLLKTINQSKTSLKTLKHFDWFLQIATFKTITKSVSVYLHEKIWKLRKNSEIKIANILNITREINGLQVKIRLLTSFFNLNSIWKHEEECKHYDYETSHSCFSERMWQRKVKFEIKRRRRRRELPQLLRYAFYIQTGEITFEKR